MNPAPIMAIITLLILSLIAEKLSEIAWVVVCWIIAGIVVFAFIHVLIYHW